MGTVNFSGLGTGIDWQQLIDAEVEVRRTARIAPIEEWKVSWENKIQTFDEISSLLTALLDTAEAMDTVAELRSYEALSSSESKLEATASSADASGSYSIEINQLASAALVAHSGVDDATTVLNNSGSTLQFAYSYDETAVTLDVPDGSTLQDLAALINNSPDNPGVSAYVLDDGSEGSTSHHLMVRGLDTGASYTVTIDTGATTLSGGWSDLTADASSGASSITVADGSVFQQYQAVYVADDDSTGEYHVINAVAGNDLTLKATLADDFTLAQNAYATAAGMGSGLAAAASTGELELVVDDVTDFVVGKTVIVADGSNYEDLTISEIDTDTNTLTFATTLSHDYAADGYVTQLEGGRKITFTDADFTEAQNARNSQIRVDGYPPGGWIEREDNVVDDVVAGLSLTLKTTTDDSPVTITVTPNTEGVKTKIEEMVNAYNAVKEYLNDATKYDTETEEAGILIGNYAADLIESQLRSIIISTPPGFDSDTDTYTVLGQIGIETVGVASDTELGTLTIDDEVLDEALTDNFEAVLRLFADDYAGYGGSNYITFYQASDLLTTPGIYDVQADFDGSGNLIAGRFKLTSQDEYRDADVDSPYLSGTAGNPEYGLWVKAVWDGSSTTQSATIRLTQGVSGQIADLLDTILDPTDGLLHNLDESYGDIISQIDDRIEAEEARLDQLRDRLTSKYASLEGLLYELQATQEWASNLSSSD